MVIRLLHLVLLIVPVLAWAQGDDTPLPDEEHSVEENYNIALLQGLNKVTARISEIEAPIGVSVNFGNLEMIVTRCWKSPPNEQPENAALIEIRERKSEEPPKTVYHGWMFSSSPSLAGLEHPVYDVIVLQCQQRTLDEKT